MASLAGNTFGVPVQNAFFMEFILMTAGAGQMVGTTRGNKHGVALDVVIGRRMAFLAAEVFAFGTHVNVQGEGRISQGFFHIAMFDVVAATAGIMAGATVVTAGSTSGTGKAGQIQGLPNLAIPFLGLVNRMTGAGGEFLVRTSLIMTDQAIDVFFVAEVKAGVFPAIAGVTAGATGPVAVDGDTKVVQGILLTQGHLALADDVLHGFPSPMGSLHKRMGDIIMTFDTGRRDTGSISERAFDVLMIFDEFDGPGDTGGQQDGQGGESQGSEKWLHAKASVRGLSVTHVVVKNIISFGRATRFI